MTPSLAKRVIEFISERDPFGDQFCEHDLTLIERAATEDDCCKGLAPRRHCRCYQDEVNGAQERTI